MRMRRVTRWAASVVGAAGAGAGLAVAHHRRRSAAATTTAVQAAPPRGAAPVPAPPASAPDDPQAALDAARQRLRDRADDLRRDIESSVDPGGL